MKKFFVSYKTALKLKKLGFDEHCFGAYRIITNGEELLIGFSKWDEAKFCAAPLYDQVMDFLLSKGIVIRISENGMGYEVRAKEWDNSYYISHDEKDTAIEEAFKI